MRQKTGEKDIFWKIIRTGIIVLTVIGFLKSILISLDIDESYAVAQAYRFVKGDRLIRDMWEPHQLSIFGCAPFIGLYLRLFHTTDYLVIFLRMTGILIHTGMGLWLYYTVKGEAGEKISFLILAIHLNFLPKWVQLPEFELMHYWFLLAAFLLLYHYFNTDREGIGFPIAAGVCLVGSMLSYPSMILLYPFYVIGICVLEKQKHRKKGFRILKGSLWFTLGAAGTGIGFLAYLFSYMTYDELIRSVSCIFLDESHTMYTPGEKWGRYLGEFAELCADYSGTMLIALGICTALLLVLFFVSKRKKNRMETGFSGRKAELFFVAVLYLTAVLMQLRQITGSLFLDENQFFLQTRYLAFLIPAVYLGIRYHKKTAAVFYLSIIPSLLSLPAALLITNMNINVAAARVFPGVLGSLLILHQYGEELKIHEKIKGVVCGSEFLAGLTVLAGFLICRIVLIRITGCGPVTVLAPMEQIKEGPAKGIYVMKEEADIWNENNRILKREIQEGDRMLFVGTENLVYLTGDCIVATPSTQGTAVYNEMYPRYYREYPDRVPDLIIIDKHFKENPIYSFFPDNQIIFDWIEENYGSADITETKHLKILRQRD